MNFADILEQWENESRGPAVSGNGGAAKQKGGDEKKGSVENSSKINPMDLWLNRYGVQDKDAQPEALSSADKRRMQEEERRRLRKMRPEAALDLHGLLSDEVGSALDAFFDECHHKDLRKVLIIHGKGLHSEGQPVLSSIVKSYIERCPFAGEHGRAEQKDGGSGATWVILKKRS